MRALPLPEAAERLAISVDTLRRNIDAGRIYAANLSTGTARKKLVVPESEIARILTPPAKQPPRPRRKASSAKRRY